jgi:hypothetical protein
MRLSHLLALGFALFLTCALQAQTKISTKTFDLGKTIGSLLVDTMPSGHHVMRAYTVHKKNNGKGYKNTGEMIFYDLDGATELWRRPYTYNGTDKMFLVPKGIIHTSGTSYELLDFNSGKRVWSKNGTIKVNLPRKNMLLAYTGSWLKDQTSLEAHSSSTGETLWSTKVEYGWDSSNYFTQGDTLLFIKNYTGLYRIDLRNGKQHFVPTPPNSSYSGIQSNLLAVDSCFYRADDGAGIACYDDTLGVRWKTTLPKGSLSASMIYLNGENVIMINSGVGAKLFGMKKNWDYAPEGIIKPINLFNFSRKKIWNHAAVGYPFVAAFDRKDGHEVFFKKVADNKAQITDCFKKDNTAYLLFGDRLAFCSLNDTTQIRLTTWNAQKYGKLKGLFVDEAYFANSDSTIFRKMTSSYYRILVYTDNANIYEVDNDMNVAASHPAGSFFLPSATCGDHTFLYNPYKSGNVFLINSLGVREHTFTDVVPKITICQNKAYLLTKDRDKIIEATE